MTQVDGDKGARRVPPAPLLLAGAALTTIAIGLWLGLSIVHCAAWFDWLADRGECDAANVILPMVTVPAIAAGGAISWRSQRWSAFWLGVVVTFAPLAVFPVAPYGFGGDDLATSLSGQVEDAMDRVPYGFRFLPDRAERGYVVFLAEDPKNGATVRIAYGGAPRKGAECRRPPGIPPDSPTRSKPAAAAGPEPLICFESYPVAPMNPGAKGIAEVNMSGDIANALCEELHGPWACFF